MELAIIFMLLVDADPEAVAVDDVQRFPHAFDASEQLDLVQQHREYVAVLRRVNGYLDGRYEAYLTRLRWIEGYWLLVYQARDTFGLGEAWTLWRLRDLKRYIGPRGYREGWTPPLLPSVPRLRREEVRPGNNGAA